MLLTIERVAFLKTIGIFAETPGHELASVARILEEVELLAGEDLIQEGESGDCLYIVIDGQLRVHSNQRTLQVIGPGIVVGELALLDPEPRAASVTAIEDAFLFRLDREPFEEVMANQPEIAQATIRTLTRRIRELGRVLSGESVTPSEFNGR